MHPPVFTRLQSEDLPRELAPLSLLFVLDGKIKLRLADGEVTRVRRGDLFVLRVCRAEVSASSPLAEVLLFEAEPEWVKLVLGAPDLGEPDAEEPAALEPAGSDLAERAQRLLCAERLCARERRAAADQAARAARCLELVSVALEARGSLGSSRPVGCAASPHAAAFVRALEALEGDDFDDCSLGRLAGSIGLSERQVARLFRRTLGTSFSTYLTQLRIERAKKLLATTVKPVTEIGLETGWQSLSHFNTVFRRRVGATPSAYRAVTYAAARPAA
jgi:AraC-like DNA-binding protein